MFKTFNLKGIDLFNADLCNNHFADARETVKVFIENDRLKLDTSNTTVIERKPYESQIETLASRLARLGYNYDEAYKQLNKITTAQFWQLKMRVEKQYPNLDKVIYSFLIIKPEPRVNIEELQLNYGK